MWRQHRSAGCDLWRHVVPYDHLTTEVGLGSRTFRLPSGTMVGVSVEPSADGFGALAEGRWDVARAAFEAALVGGDTAEECFGLAMALWWLGDNHACVDRCNRA